MDSVHLFLYLPSTLLTYIPPLAVPSLLMMSFLAFVVVLGLLTGTGGHLQPYNVTRPLCDSAEAEAAALVAQDYLNSQHTHGYKYALNQIDDIKIISKPDGTETYKLEVDLLETMCHVLDPTPVANCTVRPKVATAVQGDCDVILSNVGGVMTVIGFKCKTEESTEDLCLGCASLLPLNDTTGLALVSASLDSFNKQTGQTSLFDIMEVGRMSTQIVAGGLQYLAEYVIVETNCTAGESENCVPLTVATAQRGFCQASGGIPSHSVGCTLFGAPAKTPILDTSGTVPVPPPSVRIQAGNIPVGHGLRHHKLTALHNPNLSGLLSAESLESGESAEAIVPVVPVVPAAEIPIATDASPVAVESVAGSASPVTVVVKREAAQPAGIVESPVVKMLPAPLRCPGRKKFF
ncbi:alpha-2-HS-glycoprotein 2 [Esox lucius]|uniref:Cystatin fetuin-A-type domain-containing protein n=1 Tax=Esox lucius TaxID=8010 RepID=A0A3P9AQI0_ESOLU|nr:alpha-2-HS-glycoprotein 2 [Esox lucius]